MSSPYPSQDASQLMGLLREGDVEGAAAFLVEHPIAELHFGASTAFAALRDHPSKLKNELADVLIDAGYDVDVVHPALGTTAWVDAIVSKDFEFAKHLAQHGATTSYSSESWCSFLEGKNFVKRVADMLAAGVNDKELLPALLLAQNRYGEVEAFATTLERVSNADAIFDDVRWPLFVRVCSNGSDKTPQFVELLLDKGASIDIATPDGQTALMRAVFNGQAATIRILIERGADASRKTTDGRTLADFVETRKEPTIDLLEQLLPGDWRRAKPSEARRLIRISASDGELELEFAPDDPQCEELYNSCGIIEEPQQSREGDAFVGSLGSSAAMATVLKVIIEDAGLVSAETAQRLRDAVRERSSGRHSS